MYLEVDVHLLSLVFLKLHCPTSTRVFLSVWILSILVTLLWTFIIDVMWGQVGEYRIAPETLPVLGLPCCILVALHVCSRASVPFPPMSTRLLAFVQLVILCNPKG